MRVQIRAPEVDTSADVAEGEELLIGRRPDASARGLATQGFSSREVRIESQVASGRHVAVRGEVGGCRIRDLGSRNGTWVRVPRSGEAFVPGVAEVELRLALDRTLDEGLLDIPDAEWSAPGGFRGAVVGALDAWLDEVGVGARVECVRVGSNDDDGAALPLDDEMKLRVVPSGASTSTVPWRVVKDHVNRWLHEQRARLAEAGVHPRDFVLASRAMRREHKRLVGAAQRGLNALILGPRGSGRRTLADCYEGHLFPRGRPLGYGDQGIVVDCDGIDEAGLRRELGYLRIGSMTAPPATLTLHEVSALAPALQTTLLRFLERNGAEGVGAARGARRRPLLVCATGSEDMRELVGKGAFREDLWYLLCGRLVTLPLLRDRPEDVAAYLERSRVRELLRDDAAAALGEYPWPGNFHELTAFVDRAASAPKRAGRVKLDGAACSALLAEAAVAPVRLASPRRRSVEEPTWVGMVQRASEGFVRDRGPFPHPKRWSETSKGSSFDAIVSEFVNKHLKPLYAAVLDATAAPAKNAQDRARRIGISDARTLTDLLKRLDPPAS